MTSQSLKIKSSSLLEGVGTENPRKNDCIQQLYEYVEKYKKVDSQKLISIILPVYNEEKSIKQVLTNLPKNDMIEIIVVDDHSTDKSLEEIQKVNHKGEIHIIKHMFNRGYGEALLTGIRHCNGEVFITMDSDGQHRAEDILNLVKPIFNGSADITIGSRYKGTFNYKLPIATRLGEAILEVIIILLFKQKVKNNQGGFRALHKKTKHIFEEIKFKGYAFTTELILLSVLHKYKIKEVPINLSKREFGSSYIILRKLILRLLLCIGLYFFKKAKRILFRR